MALWLLFMIRVCVFDMYVGDTIEPRHQHTGMAEQCKFSLLTWRWMELRQSVCGFGWGVVSEFDFWPIVITQIKCGRGVALVEDMKVKQSRKTLDHDVDPARVQPKALLPDARALWRSALVKVVKLTRLSQRRVLISLTHFHNSSRLREWTKSFKERQFLAQVARGTKKQNTDDF